MSGAAAALNDASFIDRLVSMGQRTGAIGPLWIGRRGRGRCGPAIDCEDRRRDVRLGNGIQSGLRLRAVDTESLSQTAGVAAGGPGTYPARSLWSRPPNGELPGWCGGLYLNPESAQSLGSLTDLEHRGPAQSALAAGGRATVLHRYLFGLLNLSRLATLHAISSHLDPPEYVVGRHNTQH